MSGATTATAPSNEDRNGYIYVLRSEAHASDLYKIGRTQVSPEARAAQLNNTSLPSPFEVVASVQVSDCVLAEKLLIARLADHRWNSGREFFHLPLSEIQQTMHEVAQHIRNDPKSAQSELRKAARESDHIKKTIFVLPLLEYMKARNFNYRSNAHNKSLNFRIKGSESRSQILIGAYLKSNGYIWVYAYAPKDNKCIVERLCEIAANYRSEGHIRPEENWNRGQSLSVEEFLPYEDMVNVDFAPVHKALMVYAEMAEAALASTDP